MSAVTQTRLTAAPDTVAGPVSQVRVVRAEWTKLRALRSTWWCALIAVVLIVGLGRDRGCPGRRPVREHPPGLPGRVARPDPATRT